LVWFHGLKIVIAVSAGCLEQFFQCSAPEYKLESPPVLRLQPNDAVEHGGQYRVANAGQAWRLFPFEKGPSLFDVPRLGGQLPIRSGFIKLEPGATPVLLQDSGLRFNQCEKRIDFNTPQT
jgi:hypothetical protein